MKQIDEIKKRQNFLKYLNFPSRNEIYTKIDLVQEILDRLPKNSWTDPSKVWLNPAVKNGIFLSEIVLRLFEGLKDWEPDEEKRFNHIIKNMIYGFAYTEIGLLITRKTLYGDIDIEGNIKLVSFKDENINMKFDFIVGNPPYQLNVGQKKTEPIWYRFVLKSFDILNDNGYLVMIHPSGWRNIDGRFKKVGNVIKSRQIEYLKMYDNKKVKKFFDVSIHIDWYILKNTKPYKKTEVSDWNGNVSYLNLSEMPFIPNAEFEKIYSLVAKDGEEKVNILHNHVYDKRRNYMNKEKTDKYKYPCVYYINSKHDIICYYSNRNDRGHFGIPKIILTISNVGIDAMKTYIDESGKYALTQYCFGIIDDPKILPNINKCVNSDKFKKLMKMVSYGDNNMNIRVLSNFRKDFWKEFI